MFTFFNHEQFRRYLVAFGSIFNNMEIRRQTADGSEAQRIVVPIEYGPKERWYTRLKQDPDFLQGIGQVLPRMSYEVKNVQYDSSRKLNSFNSFRYPTNDHQSRVWSGVPYNLTFELAILAKTQQDALQVVEQILPFFTPDYTFAMQTVPDVNLIETIPLVLNSTISSDNYEENFEKLRAIIWTLNFTMRVHFYGPVKTAKQITEVIIDLYGSTIPGLTEPPVILSTEDGQLFLTENETGHVMDEATANVYLNVGRVARIDAVAHEDQVPEPGPNVTATVTLTEYEGDVKRNAILEDE